MPKRIQRKRTKGWRKPDNAVCVTRPSRWGNPFDSAERFRLVLAGVIHGGTFEPALEISEFLRMQRIAANLEDLRGKDLACFCPLDKPCHADVLLEFANITEGEA